MVFSSVPFLFYFLPAVLLAYFAAPARVKNSVLLAASLFFYAWGEPKFVILILLAILQGYIFGILIEKYRGKMAKVYLTASVILSLGMLAYCKYIDFFIENFNAVFGLSVPLLKIALPIGISFYTFQVLSYVVDVYRQDVAAQKNIINFAAYVSMFPQLIAGPIVRYSDIALQLEHREHSLEKFAAGLKRFIIGLGKKVLIANVLGELCSTFRSSESKSVLFFWMYAIGYTLYIYFDFSGYSDMAIGLGKLFGFDFCKNFDYPYISKTVTEFWRRWHMSLGSWFRDYVYIPLGGNRVGKLKWFRNIMIVWLLTGFWHGAAWNFIVWGLFFGILLMIEKLFLSKFLSKVKIINHVYVMLAVIISFVIFDAYDMGDAFNTIRSMFGICNAPLVTRETLYYLKSYAVVIVAAIVGATPMLPKLVKRIENTPTGAKIFNFAEPVYLLTVLLAVTGFMVDGSFNPFLYFRF